jgi:hypothetical protein
MTLDPISRDEALQVFGRRFDGAGLSDEEIAEHFDFLNAAAFSISAMGLMERFRCVCVGGDPANDLHRPDHQCCWRHSAP